MSRKTLLIAAIILIIGLALILWLLLFRDKDEAVGPEPEAPDMPCLIFQSEDPGEPCYAPLRPGEETPGEVSTSSPTTTESAILSRCDSPIAPERDDCITREAEKNDDPDICDAIPGTFGKTACRIKVESSAAVDTSLLPRQSAPSYSTKPSLSPLAPLPPSSGEAFSPADILPKSGATLEEINQDGQNQIDNPDPAYTIEGFYDRVATISEFKVYTVVPLQAKPGDAATLMGSGFQKMDNTIHVGGETIEGLESSDGMTMRFSVPDDISYGTYEIWVTNSRGSSKDAGQPIRITITANPKPVPEITGVTPENPRSTDRVTLRGNNLSGIIEISTTLGITQSLSFVPAELDFAKELIAGGVLAGQLVPVYVHVATDAGFNPEPFVFNVQF